MGRDIVQDDYGREHPKTRAPMNDLQRIMQKLDRIIEIVGSALAENARLRALLTKTDLLQCPRCGRVAPVGDWGTGELLGFRGVRCPDCWPDYSVIPTEVK